MVITQSDGVKLLSVLDGDVLARLDTYVEQNQELSISKDKEGIYL